MEKKVFVSGLSKARDWKKALEELSPKIGEDLKGASLDLGIFFVSESYKNFSPEEFVSSLQELFKPRVLLGCNSSGVIGSDEEIEMEPAVAMLAMHLPGVRLLPFHLSADQAQAIQTGGELIESLDIYPTDDPRFICLADPMSFDVIGFLNAFNEGYKGQPVVGGLASGAVMGARNWLCVDPYVHRSGVVGVALMGDIEFEIIVSQGCRPIGEPFVVTKAQDNILYEIGGRPVLEMLKAILEELSPQDRALAQHSLSVGLVMNEKKTVFQRGDFLIRNILGLDPESGAILVGALPRIGQTLQFQLRDADTSSEDLKILLEKSPSTKATGPRGAMLVSCCGRGRNFYGAPHHDVRAIQSLQGPLPLAGFFANGEIGPVDKRNYVHGYTSSLAILK